MWALKPLGGGTNVLFTRDFDYHLPVELIAQTPLASRDQSRLMVVPRSTGMASHSVFSDLPNQLREGDVLVFNDSRVVPARLYGRKKDSHGSIEFLLLERISIGIWRSLVNPGKRLNVGAEFEIFDHNAEIAISGTVLEVEDSGTRIVQISEDEKLNSVGVIPLPPYINEKLDNPERYQTVYSNVEGSIAAPTAGLHFTSDLLDDIRKKGIQTVFVTLHVGWDTFRALNTEDVSSHDMHSEAWEMSTETASTINRAKREGRRVISVGTTVVRVLEHAASLNTLSTSVLSAGKGRANLFIYPGFEFKVVDALITNFHLPKSTLLMMVSAFAGLGLVLRLYDEAVANRYRFFSFGDAMFLC